MSQSSARFALPFLLPGQAQKELFHNEALARVDAVLHAVVEAGSATVPPASPEPGQSWIVAPAAAGEWSGKASMIACWTVGGWRFVAPVEGMLAWNRAAGLWMRWTGIGWSEGTLPASALLIGGQQVVGPRLPGVPSPSGGTTIDTEARVAIAALIATLKSHGLTD
jgi:uncharacterized protein DUF2793